MSRIKIVATIGPKSLDADVLLRLKAAGMDVARLNGSHADLDWHARAVALIRSTLPDTPILLDIPGRKIRTGQLAHEPSFAAGEAVVLTTETGHDGRIKVPVNYEGLHRDLKAGDTVLADDGTLSFHVVEVAGRDIRLRADMAGTLRSRKGINVPFVDLGTQLVTDRDRTMAAFAREHGVDFIGISFVESAAHVEAIRALVGDCFPQILAKVENLGGLRNVAEVADAADAIMIDRGDLSVETSLDSMAIFQKQILTACNRAGKPVVVATEMLHSMIESPVPTKAEVSDITNAVIDGCSATMLSGETAVGGFPVEAVSIMRRVADSAAAYVQAGLDREDPEPRHAAPTVPQAVEDAIALICRRLDITKIVTVTVSGYAARMVAARRPRQPILSVSNDRRVARAVNLYAGVEGVFVDMAFPKDSTDHIVACLKDLRGRGKLTDEDLVLTTAVAYPRSGNRMNLIQTHRIGDLAAALGWDK